MRPNDAPTRPAPVTGRMTITGTVVVQWTDGTSTPFGRQQLRLLTALYESGAECVALPTLAAAYWQLCLGRPARPTAHGDLHTQQVARCLRRLAQQRLVASCAVGACALTPAGIELATWLTTSWGDWPVYAARWLHPSADALRAGDDGHGWHSPPIAGV
jgi:hypothetical protein